jgi:hypothetical protein
MRVVIVFIVEASHRLCHWIAGQYEDGVEMMG